MDDDSGSINDSGLFFINKLSQINGIKVLFNEINLEFLETIGYWSWD